MSSSGTQVTEFSKTPAAQRELVHLLYNQSIMVLVVIVVVSFFSAVIMHDHADPVLLYGWFSYMVITSLMRWLLIIRFQSRQPKDEHLSLWLGLFVVAVISAALGWGFMLVILDYNWPYSVQFFIVTVLMSVTVGAVSSLAVYFWLYVGFGSVILFALTAWLFFHPASDFHTMGILVPFFLVFLISLSRFLHQYVMDTIRLKLENEYVLDELGHSTDLLAEQMRSLGVLKKELDREKQLFDAGRLVLCRWRQEDGWPFVYVSKNIQQFGWDAQELMRDNRKLTDFLFKEEIEGIEATEFQLNTNTGVESVLQEYRIKTADGRFRWVMDVTIPVLDQETGESFFDGYIMDITEHKEAESRVLAERARAEAALFSIGDAVIMTDLEATVEYINPAAEFMLGIDIDELNGQHVADVLKLYDEDDQQILFDPITPCLRHEQIQASAQSYQLTNAFGKSLSVSYIASPLRSPESKINGCVLVLHDVTETRHLSKELAYQAAHDALTGLFNRREFETRLASMLESLIDDPQQHIMLYIDLDQFKIVNDSCGHVAGDELLKQISSLLKKHLRGSDVLARLGGDEFGVLLSSCPLGKGEEIAEQLREVIEKFRFYWGGQSFNVGSSIGLVQVDSGADSVESILRNSDIACYMAKDQGRNRYVVYRDGDGEVESRKGDLYWVNRIQQAIENDELVLCRQTMQCVKVVDEKQHGEILLRLKDVDGFVPPSMFIPALERYRKIGILDRWVIEHALKWLGDQSDKSNQFISINLSAVSLSDEGLVGFIDQQIHAHNIDPGQLCFEITETATISNLSAAQLFIAQLREMGCYIALDDFGTGLSSFEYLRNLPVDYLKIDGHFIHGVNKDKVNASMVSMICELGRHLDMKTVAEQVEDLEDLTMLREIGLDYVQGYLTGKPEVIYKA